MPLTASQLVAQAASDAHQPYNTATAQNKLQIILDELCLKGDYALARGDYDFSLNPGLITTVGGITNFGGPYPLPLDFLRTSGSSGSEGVQYAFFYVYNGVPYPLQPWDLGRLDMQVQQAGIQNLPYAYATDVSPETTAQDRLAGVTTATTILGNNVITAAATNGMLVGMGVSGTGIAAGSTITNIGGMGALSWVATATIGSTILPGGVSTAHPGDAIYGVNVAPGTKILTIINGGIGSASNCTGLVGGNQFTIVTGLVGGQPLPGYAVTGAGISGTVTDSSAYPVITYSGTNPSGFSGQTITWSGSTIGMSQNAIGSSPVTGETISSGLTVTLSLNCTGTFPAASIMFGTPANVYVYPGPSGAFPARLRYQRLMPPLQDLTRIPWFPDQNYLLMRLTADMCATTDDQRREQFLGEAIAALGRYDTFADDKTNRAQTVILDRRRFGRAYNKLNNTKFVGW